MTVKTDYNLNYLNQQATARRGQDALLLPEKNALTRINKSEKQISGL